MASPLQAALRKIVRPSPSLSTLPGNLYQVLSRYPQDGVGQKVHQTRWGVKGIEGSYWEVTRTKVKCEGRHGKAWGVLVWKGKRVSERDEQIPGGLKYSWVVGESRSKPGVTPPPKLSS
ncbi:hypothetical protein C2E23DRAFT_837187 [Lenzites betulinus]|nr:hypothetical protein C2E23DRAFT_837187 [Lenzites betulinus]